jgi:hypothetical protein
MSEFINSHTSEKNDVFVASIIYHNKPHEP